MGAVSVSDSAMAGQREISCSWKGMWGSDWGLFEKEDFNTLNAEWKGLADKKIRDIE